MDRGLTSGVQSVLIYRTRNSTGKDSACYIMIMAQQVDTMCYYELPASMCNEEFENFVIALHECFQNECITVFGKIFEVLTNELVKKICCTILRLQIL